MEAIKSPPTARYTLSRFRLLSRAFATATTMPSDVLFNAMVQFQGNAGWGRFLDAGTGLHSLKWIQGIPTSSWTAITADNNMRTNILSDEAIAMAMRQEDKVVVGNWMDEEFCSQLGMYDTILADYLIGAVDGFR
jgi:hypothetical protein